MKWTKRKLKGYGVVNPHDLAEKAGSKLFICYFSGDDLAGQAWQVIGVGYKTEPEGHWRRRGHKTFSVIRPSVEKASRLLDAKDWAEREYGIVAWERDPWGAYHPNGTLANILPQKE